MAALSSYHNIWMMNQAASKSAVMLLTQGFLPSECPVGPEGGTERREKGFVRPCSLFVMRCAVDSVCYTFAFTSVVSSFCAVFSILFGLPQCDSEPRVTILDSLVRGHP